MHILDKARRLEAKLTRTFDGAAEQWTQSGPRGPLELLHAITNAIEQGLEPAGRGKHVFPFNRIKVSVVAPSRDARARFAALFEAEPNLQQRVLTRLGDAGCDAPNLQIEIVYVDEPAPTWERPEFHIDFDRVTPANQASQSASIPETITLTVIHGMAEESSYVFSLGTIHLGRCTEVRDSRNRLIRTNQVVFSDWGGDPNTTVSRRHARIEYSGKSRQYRICDDGSAHGTGIVRNGRTINVPSGPRGMRLHSGDEILLGEARLRVTIGDD